MKQKHTPKFIIKEVLIIVAILVVLTFATIKPIMGMVSEAKSRELQAKARIVYLAGELAITETDNTAESIKGKEFTNTNIQDDVFGNEIYTLIKDHIGNDTYKIVVNQEGTGIDYVDYTLNGASITVEE